ncbi:MAG: outer membrane protein assembly factor BamE domain-containing protein [Burkholderiales bacterium]
MIALTIDNNLGYHIAFQGKTVSFMRFRFVFLVLSLTACSPSILYTPHKMDVQQGNVVTEDMLGKVKSGMTKSQVRFALGTPLISDPFHAERWDYVYRFRKDGELTEHSRLTVIFEDDKLKKVEGTALPPSDNVAGTKTIAPKAVTTLALASEQPRPAQPPALLDLKQVESDLGAALPTPPPVADAAKPAPDQGQAEQANAVQAQQPKRSFGERFLRLFGFGKKDEETQQAKFEEKPKAQPEPLIEPQPAAQAQRSFGERFLRLFGFGEKDEETQLVKIEEKPEAQPEPQQEEAEPPTNTVVTADRSPPPKRSAGERFMRLIGFKEKEGDDPALPVTTEVNTTIPRISNLNFKQVVKQILGLEDDNDTEKRAAAEDIEPGETVKSSGAQGSTWQRFKRLIGADSDEVAVSTTPVSKDQQATQEGNEAKPGAAKSEAAKP